MPDDETPAAPEPNELNDSPGGHLPYDPPTPADFHDLFETPEEMALQRKLAQDIPPAPEPPDPEPPGGESVVPDLQKTVVLDPGAPWCWQAPEPPPAPGQIESVVPDLQPVVETDFSEPGERLDGARRTGTGTGTTVASAGRRPNRGSSTGFRCPHDPRSGRPPRRGRGDLSRNPGIETPGWRRYQLSPRISSMRRVVPETVRPPASLRPDPTAIESVVPDLQKTVVLDPGDPSTWQAPLEPPPAKPPTEVSLETPPTTAGCAGRSRAGRASDCPFPGSR